MWFFQRFFYLASLSIGHYIEGCRHDIICTVNTVQFNLKVFVCGQCSGCLALENVRIKQIKHNIYRDEALGNVDEYEDDKNEDHVVKMKKNAGKAMKMRIVKIKIVLKTRRRGILQKLCHEV